MTVWSIVPLPLHKVRVPGPEVFFQRAFSRSVDLWIYAFLLSSRAGSILIDTGLPRDHAALNKDIQARKGHESGFVPAGETLELQLRKHGFSPDAIILTSLGPYAVGGLESLAGLPIHASARGLRDMEDPENPALVHPVSDEARSRLRGDCVHPIEGSCTLLPGLDCIEVGVHHPASLALVIHTDRGPVALADPVFCAENLLSGWALGASEHVAGWHPMVRALGKRAEAIIPIHDKDPTAVPRSAWHPLLWHPSLTDETRHGK